MRARSYKGASMGSIETSPDWKKKYRRKKKREQKALDDRQRELSGEVRVTHVDPDTLK